MTGAAPRVVAVGGGHGLAATLRSVRAYAGAITAIVSVADDGGSSGRLRKQLGIMPPGDLRKCLVALADDVHDPSAALARAFEHRFEAVDLAGHALGNLVLVGLTAATGDIQRGLDQAGQLLGAVGRVVPAAAEPVALKAEGPGGHVEGQSAIADTQGIRRVSLVPDDAPAPEPALVALAQAEQVVIGPGSLYTSLLAALIVPGISAAMAQTPGRRVYVANLRPQPGETAGYDVADHVRALRAHGVEVDTVLLDPASIERGALRDLGVDVVEAALAKPNGLAHDPSRLATALAGLVV